MQPPQGDAARRRGLRGPGFNQSELWQRWSPLHGKSPRHTPSLRSNQAKRRPKTGREGASGIYPFNQGPLHRPLHPCLRLRESPDATWELHPPAWVWWGARVPTVALQDHYWVVRQGPQRITREVRELALALALAWQANLAHVHATIIRTIALAAVLAIALALALTRTWYICAWKSALVCTLALARALSDALVIARCLAYTLSIYIYIYI